MRIWRINTRPQFSAWLGGSGLCGDSIRMLYSRRAQEHILSEACKVDAKIGIVGGSARSLLCLLSAGFLQSPGRSERKPETTATHGFRCHHRTKERCRARQGHDAAAENWAWKLFGILFMLVASARGTGSIGRGELAKSFSRVLEGGKFQRSPLLETRPKWVDNTMERRGRAMSKVCSSAQKESSLRTVPVRTLCTLHQSRHKLRWTCYQGIDGHRPAATVLSIDGMGAHDHVFGAP